MIDIYIALTKELYNHTDKITCFDSLSAATYYISNKKETEMITDIDSLNTYKLFINELDNRNKGRRNKRNQLLTMTRHLKRYNFFMIKRNIAMPHDFLIMVLFNSYVTENTENTEFNNPSEKINYLIDNTIHCFNIIFNRRKVNKCLIKSQSHQSANEDIYHSGLYAQCALAIQLLCPLLDESLIQEEDLNIELEGFNKYETNMLTFIMLFCIDNGVYPSIDDINNYLKYIATISYDIDIRLYEQYSIFSVAKICEFIELISYRYVIVDKYNNIIHNLNSFLSQSNINIILTLVDL